MNNYKPYPSYRPSNIEWLGDLPSHWDLRRLKFIASVTYSNVDKHTKEGEIPVRLCNYVDVYKNDLIANDLEFMEATADAGEIKKFGLQKGDVIVTKDSEEWKDIAVPAFVPEKLEGVICGYHLALIRPYVNQVDGEYLFRSFRAPAINYQFQVEASGITRYGLGKQALGDAWIILPPLPEQRAISAFLDGETAHIDSLIAKKHELIDLLDKKRTSIISHAVTKGLNPKARMKSSGVEWLGDVPEHWEIRRLKYLAGMNLETLPETTRADYKIQYIDIGNVSSDGCILGLQEFEFDHAPSRARRKVSAGSTIISTVRTYLQAIAYLETPEPNCIVSTGFAVLQPVEHVHSKYLYYLVRSKGFVDAVMSHSTGVSYPAINPSTLSGLWGCLPPLFEQKKIAEFLDQQTTYIESLVAQVEESIVLLKKQRVALISAAVTGKIDVRKQGN